VPGRIRPFAHRSIAWPLVKRLVVELDVPVVGGSVMRVHTVDALGKTLVISGRWEPNVTHAFVQALGPGDVCVDVGAHAGYYTLLASKLVGGQGHVYAFEPSPANYRVLRRNLALNHAENVTTFAAAVGPTPGSAVLYEGPGTNTGRATINRALAESVSTEGRAVTVEVRTIAGAVPESELARVRVVKVDVEGSELDVLRSLEPLFAAGAPLVVFLEFNPKWIADPDPAQYVERLCARHRFRLSRVRNGYGLEDLFPRRLEPPEPIDAVPLEPSDLLLTR
jgi:FkbM family methyltransferase